MKLPSALRVQVMAPVVEGGIDDFQGNVFPRFGNLIIREIISQGWAFFLLLPSML